MKDDTLSNAGRWLLNRRDFLRLSGLTAAGVMVAACGTPPAPGSEAALKHHLASVEAGKVDYDRMGPELADVYRKQEAQARVLKEQLGAVKSVKFVGVGSMGWDIYDVTFERGSLQYRLIVSGDGKMTGLMAMSLP